MNNFKIDFSDGLYIENDHVDDSEIIKDLNHFEVKIYSRSKKENYKLVHEKNSQGLMPKMQCFDESLYNRELFYLHLNFRTWVKPFIYKYLIPYHIDIFYNNKLEFSYSLDCRHKLILFNLEPKDEKELYLWMNVIDIFKKNMNCDIAIKNDIVYSTNEFDFIADVKYRKDNDTNRHYLNLNVGRFYIPNSQIADPYYHPDGLNNKNSLEIINDILYFSSDLFKK
jgi:hypothetical protein